MSLSAVATLAFLATVVLATAGAVQRVPRRSWLVAGVRVVRRHRWARRLCVRIVHRRLRRRHPVLASGAIAVLRATRVAS